MSDIFLSYAREDQERAKQLAAALERQGWSVFWDLTIPAGKTWRDVIEGELEKARCVVVAWTADSIRSHWVREEAEEGQSRNVLVPILFEDVRPPLGFRSIQAENFTQWDGDTQAPVFQRIAGAIEQLIGPPPVCMPTNDIPEIRNPHPLGVAKRGERGRRVRAITPDSSSAPAIETPALKTFRDPLKDGGFGPEMVIVPRGTFLMGDLGGGGEDNERPVHSAVFAQPFGIGRYAITFEEYDRFAQACGRRLPDDFGWGRERRPVVDVSWEDACAYTNWVSKQTGKTYRLPSEAEWEYAARAGTSTDYWWGDKIGSNRANCDGSGSEWSWKQTAPVGSFPANSWGLHETAGNVWEWVQDSWHGDYQGAPEDGSAWESGDDSSRVLRGGSWYFGPRFARSACRYFGVPGGRGSGIGFRVVCASPIVDL